MVGKLPRVVRPKVLAQNKTCIEGYLAIEKLPRLLQLCPYSNTPVKAAIGFEPNLAYECVSLTIEIEVTLVLKCQRCLSRMQWKAQLKSRLCIVDSNAQARRLPNNADYYVCASDKMPLTDLIEDELLLVIPQNPMHDSKDECDPEFIGYLNHYRNKRDDNRSRILKNIE